MRHRPLCGERAQGALHHLSQEAVQTKENSIQEANHYIQPQMLLWLPYLPDPENKLLLQPEPQQ